MATGNMYRNCGEVRACGSSHTRICVRQTDRQTERLAVTLLTMLRSHTRAEQQGFPLHNAEFAPSTPSFVASGGVN